VHTFWELFEQTLYILWWWRIFGHSQSPGMECTLTVMVSRGQTSTVCRRILIRYKYYNKHTLLLQHTNIRISDPQGSSDGNLNLQDYCHLWCELCSVANRCQLTSNLIKFGAHYCTTLTQNCETVISGYVVNNTTVYI